MDECYNWLAQQGKWVEVGLIIAMIVVALFSLKLMVSAAGRVIVFILSVSLLGAGFYCLHKVRRERQWIAFRIEYRGKVVFSRGSRLKKGKRCTLEVNGRFQRYQISKPKESATIATLSTGSSKPKNSAKQQGDEPDVSNAGGGIESECRIKLDCGDDIEMSFGPNGKCKYFHQKGIVSFTSHEDSEKRLKLEEKRLVITSSPEHETTQDKPDKAAQKQRVKKRTKKPGKKRPQRKEKVVLRIRRTEIRKPVLN